MTNQRNLTISAVAIVALAVAVFLGLIYASGLKAQAPAGQAPITESPALPQRQTDAAARDTGAIENGPDAEVEQFRLEELEATLRTMPPGPERDYFAGVLANRMGRIDESIRLLSGALPGIQESQPRAAVALSALADDYTKSFRYGDAARVYDDLLALPLDKPANRPRQDIEDESGMAHLLAGAAAQTISRNGRTRLKTKRSVLGSLNAELTVNGIREQWMLDTGSATSVVSRSFARRLGLTPLPGHGQAKAGVTGIENPLQMAVLPTLQMGGATLHNVVLVIFDDENLKITLGKQAYQINGIIGYPVFQALGTITFFYDGRFEAADKTPQSGAGTRMYMDLLTPVIECGIEGADLPFSFDTGGISTALTARYYERFRSEVGGWLSGEIGSVGLGGRVTRQDYVQPRLSLAVGDKTAILKYVPIFPTAMGSNLDDLYGNLGQDVVAQFASFTMDFSNMTFTLGRPLAQH